MAKAYAKNADFQLSDKFWKTYKPDAVKDTGLGEALRKYEKARVIAEKLGNEKDVGHFEPNEAAKAWALVCKTLGDVATALPAVATALDKARAKSGIKPADATSMQNLGDAIEKAAKQLNAHSHPSYVNASGRKQKYTKMALEYGTGVLNMGELGFQEFLKRQKVAEVRSWKSDVRKLLELCPKPLLAGDFANTVRGLSEWDRKGTLKITSVKTFASEVERSVDAREKAMNVFDDTRRKARQDFPENTALYDLLTTLVEATMVDRIWWEDLGKDGAKEIDKLRKDGFRFGGA